jgi:4-amino-4-deoxychorismate lyase
MLNPPPENQGDQGGPSRANAHAGHSQAAPAVDPLNPFSWLWVDGAFEPHRMLPLSDRGFRYGMSVFETLRVSEGRPGFLQPHLGRLRAAAHRCGFPLPEDALSALPTLLNQCRGTGVARVYITGGDGAPGAPAKGCRVVVLYEPRSATLASSYALRSCPLPHLPPFGGLKTGNYWANAEALRDARSHGADEALLFQPDGRLTGACMANAFVKTPDGWITPTLQCGARDGVVREWALQNLSARETPVTRDSLPRAKSLFLTSSWIGLMQIHSLDGRALSLSPEINILNPL